MAAFGVEGTNFSRTLMVDSKSDGRGVRLPCANLDV